MGPSDTIDSGPETEIVNLLCDRALVNFSLNKMVLINWQAELNHESTDMALLDHLILEVILLFPSNSTVFNPSSCEALQSCLTLIDDLDNEIYHEFKLFTIALIHRATTSLYSIKVQLRKLSFLGFLASNIATYLANIGHHPSLQDRTVFAYKKELLVSFMELGCDNIIMKKLLGPLLPTSLQLTSPLLREFHLEILTAATSQHTVQPSFLVLNNFYNSQVPMAFDYESPLLNCFTISAWFKVNTISNDTNRSGNQLSCVTLFLFTSTHDLNPIVFKIQLVDFKKFVMILHNTETGSKISFTFNILLDSKHSDNQGFTHMVLTYDKYQNLNLFVDGEYCESIPCPSLAHHPCKWNKVYLGSEPGESYGISPFARCELILRDLFLVGPAIPYEWIYFFYGLGVGYTWSCKEFTDTIISEILSQMTSHTFTKLDARVQDIVGIVKASTFSFKPQLSTSMVPTTTLKGLKNHGKTRVLKALLLTKLKKADFLFDLSSSNLFQSDDTHRNPIVIFNKTISFYDSIYILGGGGIFLVSLENIIKDDIISLLEKNHLFMRIIELLFGFLQNHPTLAKEFQEYEGYWILSLMASYHKTHYNRTLDFNQEVTIETSLGLAKFESLLECYLLHVVVKDLDSRGSVISNLLGYKSLILNFDFFLGTLDFPALISHLKMMLGTKSNQMKEICGRMKVSSKVCQLLRKHILLEASNPVLVKEFDIIVRALLAADPSAESIKLFAEFVILALFHNSTNSDSKQIGLNVLQALTDKFCDPKLTMKEVRKFSRSMSIYWILLLFDFRVEAKQFAGLIVCCGIRLLAKLLKVLGAPIARKFIKQAKGLDVLTEFLKYWWNDDRVLAHLLISSFEVDITMKDPTGVTIYQILESEDFETDIQKVSLPGFILLLNNLVLVGAYNLSEKQGNVLSAPNSPARKSNASEANVTEMQNMYLDLLHLLNQLSSVACSDYSQTPSLMRVLFSKEWLESAFEIVAYLKLLHSNAMEKVEKAFVSTNAKFLSALSSIFISKIGEMKLLLSMLRSVNDITAKLIYESVFPKIFEHLSEITFSSQFVFQENELIRCTISLLEMYYEEYVQQNFKITPHDLEIFINCGTIILEKEDIPSKSRRYLGSIIGRSIIIKLSRMSSPRLRERASDEMKSEMDLLRELDDNVKFCLYKQALFLERDIFSDEVLHQIIVLVMGFYLKLSTESQLQISEHVLNFMRTLVMIRRDTFDWIIERLIDVCDYRSSKGLIKEFFNSIVTKNDEDTIRYLQKFPTIKQIINQSWQLRMRKLEDVCSVRMIDMVQVVLGNGGTFGNLSASHISNFKLYSESLKNICIEQELMKYGRDEQDKLEGDIFAISSFNTVKTLVHRMLLHKAQSNEAYTLHYTEGIDRMRKLLILEDDLLESEKLSYTISVPVKPLNSSPEGVSNGLNIAFGDQKQNAKSVLELSLIDIDLAEYEEIDENGDSESLTNSSTVFEDRNRKVLRSLFMGDHIRNLFNVSQIQGLDSVESLMILGFTHVYLIEHYFHCTDGNVIDVDEAPPNLRDPYIQLIKPNKSSPGNKAHRSRSWSIDSLTCISRRKFLLRDIGLEMFFSDGASILITCSTPKQRDVVFSSLSSHTTGKGLDRDLAAILEILSSPLQLIQEASNSGSFFSSKFASAFSSSSAVASRLLGLTKKWQEGKMSNFFYLMAINTMAGRTFNDLSQYPVFPWVISDYESAELDLNDPKTFRDLSKPMGAQTQARAERFQERYEALSSFNDPDSPPFHYGTHYSSAMIVSSYLIRMRPFVQSYLLLQGGSFDHADRLFNSVKKAWQSASRDNTTDVRELTPEFFFLPEFLVNSNNFELGKLQSGASVNDVELPKWAKGDPKQFISKNREALESPYVSQNLHKWIDLVFGFQQNGQAAVEALNVFHHLSYEGAINLDNINDEVKKRAVIGMINNFGQTPLKLFSKPHPCREVLNMANKYMTGTEIPSGTISTSFESKLHMPISKIEFSNKSHKWIGRPECTSSEEDILIRKVDMLRKEYQSTNILINGFVHVNLHLTQITCILQVGNKLFLTASSDGLIKAWRCYGDQNNRISLQNVLRGHLFPILSLILNRSFNVGLSLDIRGGLMLWDLTRFKFVRSIDFPDEKELQVKKLVATSNDTGNFCVVTSSKFANALTVYTINGEIILQKGMEPGEITAVAFAQANLSLCDNLKTEYVHSYWSSEFITVSYCSPRRALCSYEISCDSLGFKASLVNSFDMSSIMSNSVTALTVIKETEYDMEEKLSRGHLKFVVGDSKGRVLIF